MINARGKSIDTTFLSINNASVRGFPHADYIAHCLRWTHVIKALRQNNTYQSARVLDIGCGKELPLAKTLYSSRLIVEEYIGVDYNPYSTFDVSPFHTGKFPMNAFGRVDFASNQVWFDKAEDGRDLINVRGDNKEDYFLMPNVLVSFEVVEHIEPAHVRATLLKAVQILRLSNGIFFLSTPNWDVVHLADNHVNEMKHEALGWTIEDCGLAIQSRNGTFASQKDYKHRLFKDYPGSAIIYDKLHDYYESNYLATIFAPLYPAEARNCLWTLVPMYDGYQRKFPTLTYDETKPWTSSASWRDLNPEIGAGRYDSTKTGA